MEEDMKLKKKYLNYLIFLYQLEYENGFDVGDYPTYEQFIEIEKQERLSSRAIH